MTYIAWYLTTPKYKVLTEPSITYTLSSKLYTALYLLTQIVNAKNLLRARNYIKPQSLLYSWIKVCFALFNTVFVFKCLETRHWPLRRQYVNRISKTFDPMLSSFSFMLRSKETKYRLLKVDKFVLNSETLTTIDSRCQCASS